MKKIHIIVFLISFLITTNYCQTDSLESFFPLQVGNYWQYQVIQIFWDDTTYSYAFAEVLKDTVIGPQSNSYYALKVAFSGKPFSPEDTIRYVRYDSLSSSIIEYDNIWGMGESTLFKLNAVENDCWDYFGIEVCCAGIDTLAVFGEDKQRKTYHTADSSPPFWDYKLARDFGPIKIVDDQSWGFILYSVYNLVYAKINGMDYGILSMDDNKNFLENNSLSQNYPNPFNPTTTIKYHLPEISFITIKIYNVLGKEIVTLVYEEKPAGEYEVEFDGSGLPSGIYFYQLRAGQYVETKKMVLLE
jgi:hypothetical protein